jgi:hypothetical protein
MKSCLSGSTRALACGLCLVAAVLSGGCGPVKETIPDLVPVSGKVTYQGKPLADAVVTFLSAEGEEEPTELNNIYRPSGKTNADGEFELAWGEHPGAPPGKYVVCISATHLVPDPNDPGEQINESLIPTEYNAVKTSGLKANVKEEGGDNFNFDLQ